MAYEKTTWENGDIITAEKLNNIENGIAFTNKESLFPVLKIVGDYDIGDTIYQWSDVYNYVYQDDGSAILVLNTSGTVYVYLITSSMGYICLNDNGYAPNISISGDGTISE